MKAITYRKNYKPSSFLIDQISLCLDIFEEKTIVTSKLFIRKNPKINPSDPLILDGENQQLKWIKLNDHLLIQKDFQIDKEHLTIPNVPENFTLEIQSIIKPQENTLLEGFYKSNDLFCTQCESEGFRHITYYIDRPDVLAKFTTKIIADQKKYPVLLSNGNLIKQGTLNNNRHFVVWKDPFFKPCYLFAAVAGDLDVLKDEFQTKSGRKVALKIYSEKGNGNLCKHAMTSVKKAMKWDEEHYGREYDLDIFMIVAVRDFNFGAMENKGLNIFNEKYILANPKTATDYDYESIDTVVAHEYFHNWTGDRVTCRDWFQLCLKEGLTVFRDQSFTEDVTSRAIQRIDQVETMRNYQFPEDAGPLAHPIRPNSYIIIDNFYTTTVYEKGAEVIRMMHTLLEKSDFRKGMDLYFERHDGQAVTCEDFIKAMEDANNKDLSQFRLWYSQAGTPTLHIQTEYDKEQLLYNIHIQQTCPATPNQPNKKPFHIPFKMALLTQKGKLIAKTEKMFEITKEKETFTFKNINEKPIPSLLREFSAPVILNYDYSDNELLLLIEKDIDPFSRWEALQKYWIKLIFQHIKTPSTVTESNLFQKLLPILKSILTEKNIDQAYLAELMLLPSETYLAELMEIIDVEGIHQIRLIIQKAIAEKLKNTFDKIYHALNIQKPYAYNNQEVARRSLKNVCLSYLSKLNTAKTRALCTTQFETADNMTDQIAALSALNQINCTERKQMLKTYYQIFKSYPRVIDKWFSIIARSHLTTTSDIIKLMEHADFHIKNPNRVRSVISAFSQGNLINFHTKDGSGYQLIADIIIRLDKINPQIAAGLLKPLTRWKRFDILRQSLMKQQLNRIKSQKNLSNNVYEIVTKGLK